jgi:hypothetical protein
VEVGINSLDAATGEMEWHFDCCVPISILNRNRVDVAGCAYDDNSQIIMPMIAIVQ